jgi:CHRD domain
MRKIFFLAVIVVVALAVAGTTALATGSTGKKRFDARLTGFQEVPAVSTGARGTFTARLDGEVLSYTLSYSGLEGGNALFAHIHLGQRGVNGGVSAFLCGGAPPASDKPACPATEGTVTGTIDPADVIGPTAQGIAPGEFDELIRAMRAGVTYANVHTPMWPGGEIRGQIR